MEFLTTPFHEPEVRHSFAAVLALALGAGPVGVFLMLRRMSLVGDAMSHAILPGVAAGVFEALQKGDALRAERLARWACAYDPGNAEAHRNLGLALAMQGKIPDAMCQLVQGTREQATQILSGVLYQHGKLADAMTVLDYASRWYVRADQWLTYGGIAYAAGDVARTAFAYQLAYQLDPDAFKYAINVRELKA